MLPTLAILVLCIAFGERARVMIQRLYDKYATGDAKASGKVAVALPTWTTFLFLVIR